MFNYTYNKIIDWMDYNYTIFYLKKKIIIIKRLFLYNKNQTSITIINN